MNNEANGMKTILIIGAGLGGLALAQLIQKESSSLIKVIVFERDAEVDSREQGYFITLYPMGIDVLKLIPNIDDIFEHPSTKSYDQHQLKLADKSLNTTLDWTSSSIKIVDRSLLRQNLLKNVDVRWNKRFMSYKVFEDSVEAYFEDGSVVKGTILIGCDGAKSFVRSQLVPDLQRSYTGIIHVAGLVEHNDELLQITQLVSNSLVQVFGDQGYSLFMISTGQYWLWSLSWPSSLGTEAEISQMQLNEKIRQNFNNEELIRLANLSSSIKLKPLSIYSFPDLKVNPFPNNPRVTLMGDAAHLMTPHRGMGANTTFADALDLANVILNGHTKSTLGKYEEKMFKRGFQCVRDSLQSTRTSHMIGTQARIRDYFIWILSYYFSLRNLMSRLYNWYWNRT